MLPPTLRELMEDAGIADVRIDADKAPIVGRGKFAGTKQQLRGRLDGDIEFKLNETVDDDPAAVRCWPRV